MEVEHHLRVSLKCFNNPGTSGISHLFSHPFVRNEFFLQDFQVQDVQDAFAAWFQAANFQEESNPVS